MWVIIAGAGEGGVSILVPAKTGFIVCGITKSERVDHRRRVYAVGIWDKAVGHWEPAAEEV